MPRISQLPSLTTAANDDELPIVDVSASTTNKITRGDLLKAPLPIDSVTTAAITDANVTLPKLNGGTTAGVLTTNSSGAVSVPTITSGSNSGTAGGTINYVNLGGLKLCWGRTNSITNAANTETSKSIIFPTSFFTSTPTCTASIDAATGSVIGNYWIGNSVSSSAAQIYWRNSTSGTGVGGVISWLAIGV